MQLNPTQSDHIHQSPYSIVLQNVCLVLRGKVRTQTDTVQKLWWEIFVAFRRSSKADRVYMLAGLFWEVRCFCCCYEAHGHQIGQVVGVAYSTVGYIVEVVKRAYARGVGSEVCLGFC